MRKGVFVNNLKLIIISLGLSMLYWWVTNSDFLFAEKNYNLFREINASIYGYSSLQSYFLIYLAPFLLLLNFFIKDEKDYRTVRLKSRKRIAINRIVMLCKTIGVIFLPHFFIQIVLCWYLFRQTTFINTSYFMVEILQLVNVIIVFFICGLCYENLILFLKKEIGLYLGIVLYILYYFFNRICINYLLLREMCIKDLIIAGDYTREEFVITIVRNTAIVFVLIMLMLNKLKEADVYER